MLTIGSLFSGIGGLELGLERAGLGPVLWQVEIDNGARAVLAHHWPEVHRADDVRAVGAANLAPVDLICGGFPCQDVSSAGKRAGLGGARSGLWFEYRRIVSELRPKWVVVENVASGAAAWVDQVAQGLGELGYATLPVPLAAADVGAPHERARIFVVAAHADAWSESAQPEHAEVEGASSAERVAADAHRAELRLEQGWRRRASRQGKAVAARNGEARNVAADAVRARRERASAEAPQGRQRPIGSDWRTPIPNVLRVVHGISAGVDDRNARPRIQALGNAVVPQCAEVVGHVIKQLMGAQP